jgi:transposase-like protein
MEMLRMYTLRETKRTSQIELLEITCEVKQKECRSCRKILLAEDFGKYIEGHLRADCRKCHKERQREYIETIQDKRAVYRQRERARRNGLPDRYTDEDYLKLKAFADGKCMVSGEETTLQCDHMQAISKGVLGSTSGNIILVSEKVNQSKRAMSLFEWLKSERSNGLVDEVRLKRTLIYLAHANNMTLDQYIIFLKDCETLAIKSKEYFKEAQPNDS